MRTLPIGSVIGILGGGQLGRMTALAAAQLGYKTHIFCQSADEPAAQVTSLATLAAFNDFHALSQFAQSVDVITLEWENVPIASVEHLNAIKPVFPAGHVLAVAQDRAQEKSFARAHNIPTADFALIESADDIRNALPNMALPAFLKTRRMGYDGKGQIRVDATADADFIWRQIGKVPCILESAISFSHEISVIVARNEAGAMCAFPPALNHHKNGILAESIVPCGLPQDVIDEALTIAKQMTSALNVVGLLAIEMFVLAQPNEQGARILLNEIAPRPHNSGHWTQNGCATSQFEQLVRAICGLPFGSTAITAPTKMLNLMGHDVEQWHSILENPNAHLHLYGKSEIKDGRKMGHVNIRMS